MNIEIASIKLCTLLTQIYSAIELHIWPSLSRFLPKFKVGMRVQYLDTQLQFTYRLLDMCVLFIPLSLSLSLFLSPSRPMYQVLHTHPELNLKLFYSKVQLLFVSHSLPLPF